MWLAIGAVVAIGVVADLAWILNGTVVPWDSKNEFYPVFRFLADELAKGAWPFWNPYHYSGYPAAADPQSLVFSPTMVMLAWAVPKASMQTFDAWIMAHLTLGGLGFLALFRRRNWGPLGAVLAAMIFMLGGSASGRLQHTGMILSYSFFPWALFLLETALEKRSYIWGLFFAYSAVLMAQGRDQVAFLFCLWLIAVVLWETLHAPEKWLYLRQRLLLLIFMALVGGALLAGPMLLTFQLLAQSNRPAIAFGVAAEGSLSIINLVTMALPNFFGSLDWNYDYWGPGYETIPHGDWTDRAVNYLFIGTLPTLLLMWDGLLGRRLFDKPIRLFAIILIVLFFYAIGRSTPVFEWIFDHIPGVSMYRRPADATFAINVCFAILAGYFVNDTRASGFPHILKLDFHNLWIGTISAAFVAVFVMALKFSYEQHHLFASLETLAVGIAIIGLAVALLVYTQNHNALPLVLTLFVGVTGAELIWRNASSSLDSEPVSAYGPYAALPPAQQAGLDTLRADIAMEHERGNYPRVEILGISGAWMNASMTFGLENTVGYNPLRIADYERAVGPGDNSGDISLRRFPEIFRGYSSRLAKLLGLQYLVLGEPMRKLPRHFPRPITTTLYTAEGIYIYKLRPPEPRAYFATSIKPIDSQETVEAEEIPEFDRTREVLLDNDSVPLLTRTYAPTNDDLAANADVQIKAMHANSVLIEVTTDRPGILVLHDIYYPGWEVLVDNEPAKVLRTNILFRGVELAAGHHIVKFDFKPFSLENMRKALNAVLRRQNPI